MAYETNTHFLVRPKFAVPAYDSLKRKFDDYKVAFDYAQRIATRKGVEMMVQKKSTTTLRTLRPVKG